MPLTVKPITLWRKEIENKPGSLAGTLQPLAKQNADLQIVMGYRFPGHEEKAAIELYPVAGKAIRASAESAGFHGAAIPALLVEGDNRPGLGYAISDAIAGAGINLDFLIAQVLGRRYSAVLGFESEADLKKAASLIKKAAGASKSRSKT